MAHKVITPPTQEPVSLVEVRAHLRLDAYGDPPTHPEDALILAYLSAARESAEMFVNVALAPQVWEMALDAFPADAIELEGGSVGEILSIRYVDGEGVERLVHADDFEIDTYSTPNWLLPSHRGPGWPSTLGVANAVKIRYRVGVDPLPPSIRAALLLTVGHLYVNREENVLEPKVTELKMGVQHLLWPFRRGLGV